jgi:hypothetical protein
MKSFGENLKTIFQAVPWKWRRFPALQDEDESFFRRDDGVVFHCAPNTVPC